jgi:hypothetical protein
MRLTRQRRHQGQGLLCLIIELREGEISALIWRKMLSPDAARTSPPYERPSTAFSTTIWGDVSRKGCDMTRNAMRRFRPRAPPLRAGARVIVFSPSSTTVPVFFLTLEEPIEGQVLCTRHNRHPC